MRNGVCLEGVYFLYTLHFSLVHSQTVVSVLHVIYMLPVFFDLRCEGVTYTYVILCMGRSKASAGQYILYCPAAMAIFAQE